MELHHCRLCGSEAWEQTRGLLVEQPKKLRDLGVPPTKDEKDWVPWSTESFMTSTGPQTASNIRIVCSVCYNTTGWMAAETADYMRFCWNRDNPDGPLDLTNVVQPPGAPVADATSPGKDDGASGPSEGWSGPHPADTSDPAETSSEVG